MADELFSQEMEVAAEPELFSQELEAGDCEETPAPAASDAPRLVWCGEGVQGSFLSKRGVFFFKYMYSMCTHHVLEH